MHLEVLATRTSGAAENMAVDFLLLQRYPRAVPRFRHYEWRGPAFTFGYSQKIAFVRESLAATEPPFELCRRATGGGIVDHRNDWTFALVIPRGHPLEERRATQSYREIHEALADALRVQSVAAKTKPCVDEPAAESETAPGPAGVCFQRAEIYDVVHARTGEKIAGAAQKRNKHGLLFQGSIWRPNAEADGTVDWDQFEEDFIARLAQALGAEAQPTPWPEFADGELDGLVEQYSAPEWTEHR